MFGLSMPEMIIVFLIILLLFGAKKLPELARSMGKAVREFKNATEDFQREFDMNNVEEQEKKKIDEKPVVDDLKKDKAGSEEKSDTEKSQ